MEGQNKKKRERSENWLKEDKVLLKALVRERVQAIENKDTCTNSNIAKTEAWRDLRENFNAMCQGVPRTVAQLKAQWSLIKIYAKKQRASVDPAPKLAPDTSVVNDSDSDETQQITLSQSSEVKEKKQPPTVKKKKFHGQHSAESLVAFEIQCREELHQAQMANEELIKSNLLLKQKLLLKKLEFLERSMHEK